MLGAFWQAVGGKLAERAAAVSIPALIFWLGGLATWTFGQGGVHALSTPSRWLDQQTAPTQLAVILVVLLTVGASGVIVSQLATPALRLLEGYWPGWTEPVRRRLIQRLVTRAARDSAAWQTVYAHVHPPATPTSKEVADYTRLERRLRRCPSPATPGYFLPTAIGNILRAAERRPLNKYGLDTVVLWPRLWPALPDNARADIRAARMSLDSATCVAIWGILFCVFAPFSILAVPLGIAVATVTIVFVVPARAQVFGDLLEAAYDQHRTLLYTQLRWPLPANPHEEREHGQRLTTYLWRGSDDTTPAFTHPRDPA
ncbi:hypothetical protein CC117_12555 [Parafrankia colletiae]|uniref:Uncharacterized protein n=1 Tax=Parafrankia colletiae TaxID=573497 RepID=A0A1S1R855_9ACTN|nr:hypothetical protein [Parafrankia colletiae]MCK9900142.1 hypothetical protein [Frankia sp. Cpl3]OHV42380.1 hypothetical protein CC117_12555 [Parafrankia colletiae]